MVLPQNDALDVISVLKQSPILSDAWHAGAVAPLTFLVHFFVTATLLGVGFFDSYVRFAFQGSICRTTMLTTMMKFFVSLLLVQQTLSWVPSVVKNGRKSLSLNAAVGIYFGTSVRRLRRSLLFI